MSGGDVYEKTAAGTWTLRGSIATGVQGAAGAQGPQGPQGVKGDTGAQGPAGSGGVPTVVNGQWLKGVGGAAVWTALADADIGAAAPRLSYQGMPLPGDDFNGATANGWYYSLTTSAHSPFPGSYLGVHVVVAANNAAYIRQFAYDYGTTKAWMRSNIGNVWTAWAQIYPVIDAPLSTTMPASPVEGQMWTYPVDARTQWRFRWNSASGVWEFIGGPPYSISVGGDEIITDAGQWCGTNASHCIFYTPPFTGDYVCRANALMLNGSQGYLGVADASVSWQAIGPYGAVWLSGSYFVGIHCDTRLDTIPGGHGICVVFYQVNYTSTVQQRNLTVTPCRFY